MIAKILFMDIDGCLNNDRVIFAPRSTKDRAYKRLRPLLSECPEPLDDLQKDMMVRNLYHLDTRLIQKLNVLTDRPDVGVVVSSAWRIMCSETVLRWMLEKRGFRGNILGVTPRSHAVRGLPPKTTIRRGHEIQDWLNRNPTVTHFTILDDDSDMEHLRPHLVQTLRARGVTAEIVRTMEKMLDLTK